MHYPAWIQFQYQTGFAQIGQTCGHSREAPPLDHARPNLREGARRRQEGEPHRQQVHSRFDGPLRRGRDARHRHAHPKRNRHCSSRSRKRAGSRAARRISAFDDCSSGLELRLWRTSWFARAWRLGPPPFTTRRGGSTSFCSFRCPTVERMRGIPRLSSEGVRRPRGAVGKTLEPGVRRLERHRAGFEASPSPSPCRARQVDERRCRTAPRSTVRIDFDPWARARIR